MRLGNLGNKTLRNIVSDAIDDFQEYAVEKMFSGAKTIGKATYNASKATIKGTAKGVAATSPYAWSGIKTTTKGIYDIASTIGEHFDPLRPVKAAGKAAFNFGDKLVEKRPVEYKRNKLTGELVRRGGYRVTGLGIGVLGSFATASSAIEGLESTTAASMGTVSAGMKTLTPDFNPREYSFINNGGATGDLAFALHNNRKG